MKIHNGQIVVVAVALIKTNGYLSNRLDRMASRDVDYDGFKIPKGMVVTYPIRLIHMDPEVYPEPDMFIPER